MTISLDKPCAKITPLRAGFFITLLFLTLSCGGSGGDLAENDSRSRNIDSDRMTLRWFPVDDAVGYKVYFYNSSGELLGNEDVEEVRGCTHRAIEGFTSGICSFESFPSGSVRISSINQFGEGERSVEVFVSADEP